MRWRINYPMYMYLRFFSNVIQSWEVRESGQNVCSPKYIESHVWTKNKTTAKIRHEASFLKVEGGADPAKKFSHAKNKKYASKIPPTLDTTCRKIINRIYIVANPDKYVRHPPTLPGGRELHVWGQVRG